eukprot:418188-Amphidinium_carterae.1
MVRLVVVVANNTAFHELPKICSKGTTWAKPVLNMSWHWLPFDLGYLLLLCPTGHAVDGAPKKEELESKADDKEEFIQLKERQP